MNHLSITPTLLLTEDSSPIWLSKNNVLYANQPKEILAPTDKFQHLYLCSNEDIKIGDWVLVDGVLYKVEDGKDFDETLTYLKVILTTDPKLIADGVLPIDGNTKASFVTGSKDLREGVVIETVNFLTEFRKRWNEKNRVGIVRNGEPLYQPDTKKVDVEKLAEKYCGIKVSTVMDSDEEYFNPKYREYLAFIAGAKALQSTGQFSLEDMKEALRVGVNIGIQNVEKPKHENDFNFNQEKSITECKKFIQSLTPQPKGEIVIEVEMEEWTHPEKYDQRYPDLRRIKLTNGQPTLIFKCKQK